MRAQHTNCTPSPLTIMYKVIVSSKTVSEKTMTKYLRKKNMFLFLCTMKTAFPNYIDKTYLLKNEKIVKNVYSYLYISNC